MERELHGADPPLAAYPGTQEAHQPDLAAHKEDGDDTDASTDKYDGMYRQTRE